jgi:hypothetical protein
MVRGFPGVRIATAESPLVLAWPRGAICRIPDFIRVAMGKEERNQ